MRIFATSQRILVYRAELKEVVTFDYMIVSTHLLRGAVGSDDKLLPTYKLCYILDG